MDLEARTIQALTQPDPTLRRMAAVRAHKVLPASGALMTALEDLFTNDDAHLRRAAIASYVVLHPDGPAAARLKAFHDDPAVGLTASGWLLEHEAEHLKGVVRSVARGQQARRTSFSDSAALWHRWLWLYSPNPRAAAVLRATTSQQLDADADALREALEATLHAGPPPSAIDGVRVYVDLKSSVLELQGFIDGRLEWSADALASFPAFRLLDAFRWEDHDDPWPWALLAGSWSFAVARAIDAMPSAFPASGGERAMMTCFDCNGEEIFLGLLGDVGMRDLSRREAAVDVLERGFEIEQAGAMSEPIETTLFK